MLPSYAFLALTGAISLLYAPVAVYKDDSTYDIHIIKDHMVSRRKNT